MRIIPSAALVFLAGLLLALPLLAADEPGKADVDNNSLDALFDSPAVEPTTTNSPAPTPAEPSPTPQASVEKTASSDSDGSNPDAAKERIIHIHHPNAAKGLIRINDDKSYQYNLKQKPKTYANSYSISMVSPPNVSNVINGQTITYKSVYGSGNLLGIVANYEWMPVRRFGTAGVIFEGGISTAHGNGILASTPPEPAIETYTLIVIPLSVFAKYRFEYARHQAIVPYLEAGATYYALAEIRSDNQQTNLAGSEAAGGGGGVAINISGSSSDSAFRLNTEFGVTDLWLNLEARAMFGLKQSLDFTNDTINVGITVDY